MERKFDFYLTDNVYKAKENMTIMGDMYSGGEYSEFKELTVHGDCIVKKAIKADRLIVYGNLSAESVIVKELKVEGNVNVSKISVYDMSVKGNFISDNLRAHYSTIIVVGKVKMNYISGEIIKISVGDET